MWKVQPSVESESGFYPSTFSGDISSLDEYLVEVATLDGRIYLIMDVLR